ncbi:hypothetical protein [uncultured Deinococcus sp.]|uniref:hypothetical protein n=1 Tax=Deinococcus yunweiensis TaxID=367282 RepID=UPI0025E92105|nr:hypothetical protein [uncultured Deinococcus sp.]
MHLVGTTRADAYAVAEAHEAVRFDLEAMHGALRAGFDVEPPEDTQLWAPEFSEDRAAQELLATSAGRALRAEAWEGLTHVHFWQRGAQLLTEIGEGDLLTGCGLPGTGFVWAVFGFGRIMVGSDDVTAVDVSEDEDGNEYARMGLFTSVASISCE